MGGGASGGGEVWVSTTLNAPLAWRVVLGDHAVTTSRVEESGSGGGKIRGITGSSPRTTASGAASVVTEAGEASIPPVTADILPVPPEGGGVVVVTSVNGGLVGGWRSDVVGRRKLDVLGVGVLPLSVVVTATGTAVIVGLFVVTVVVVRATVAMVTAFGVRGLVVGGAEVGSLNWGG